MRREYASIAAMAALLVGSQAVAIALSPLFQGSGYQAFPNPSDVTNTVVDTVGFVTAAGVTAILGISFGAIPAILLLVALAFYDAWAVYRTKHMITLADELTSQRLPILLVIPKKAGYSFREQKSLKAQVASGEEREAMFIGLGDLIIPGIMSVSAFTFLTAPGRSFLGLEPNAFVAAGTVLGSLVGFFFLMRFVLKGNPQAGLPLLNGGALLRVLLTNRLAYGHLNLA